MFTHPDQNSTPFITLLAAQRQFYNDSKTWRALTTGFSMVLALTGIVVINLFPTTNNDLLAIGVIWSIISIFLQTFIHTRSTQAAKVQEQFDTQLYNLPWNSDLVGEKIAPELIQDASRRLKSKAGLQDWYVNWTAAVQVPNTEHWVCVLKCQRENLIWDWRIRKKFAIWIFITTLLIPVTEITAAYIQNLHVQFMWDGYIVPSISLIIAGIQSARQHYKIADLKENKANELRKLIDEKADNTITEEKCRRVQDFLFIQRIHNYYVPNWFNQLNKERFERDSRDSSLHT